MCFEVLLLVEGVFFILFCLRGDFVANAFTDKLDAIVADAAVASAAVGTIVSGSDAVVDNFAGLKDLVDELSAFASLMKSNTFYAPVGLIAPFGGLSGSIPAGWFLCDGSAKSTTTYADLYAVLGANAYGTDAGGNFVLPDLRGRVPFGLNSANSSVDARTDNDGLAEANRRPQHSHTASSNTTGAHTHSVSHTDQGYASPNSGNGQTFIMGNLNGYNNFGTGVYLQANSNGDHSHTITVAPSAPATGGSPTDTVPYVVTNYIIKW